MGCYLRYGGFSEKNSSRKLAEQARSHTLRYRIEHKRPCHHHTQSPNHEQTDPSQIPHTGILALCRRVRVEQGRSPEEHRPPATQQREVKPQLRNLVLELGCSRGLDGGGSLFCALNTLKSPLNGALTPRCYDGDSAPGSGLPGFSPCGSSPLLCGHRCQGHGGAGHGECPAPLSCP